MDFKWSRSTYLEGVLGVSALATRFITRYMTRSKTWFIIKYITRSKT